MDIVSNLVKLNRMKPLIDKILLYNKKHGNSFGYLPLIVCSSECQLGALKSQCFSEIVNSSANLVVDNDKRSLQNYAGFVDISLVTLYLRTIKPFVL